MIYKLSHTARDVVDKIFIRNGHLKHNVNELHLLPCTWLADTLISTKYSMIICPQNNINMLSCGLMTKLFNIISIIL